MINSYDIINYFKNMSNYKTKDVSLYSKKLIKDKCDVSPLREYALEYNFCHRIYFEVQLKQRKSFEERIKFVEENFDLLQDWWHVDQLLSLLKPKGNFEFVFNKTIKYLKSSNYFVRRFAYVIYLLGYQKEEKYFEKITSLLKDDDEYYVQMAQAWLICDLMVYHPDLTYEFLRTSNLNYNIIGKSISKCIESFRVSFEMKIKLKKLREFMY